MAWKLDNTAKQGEKKSPLKRPNRRLPGQSLDEQIAKLRDDAIAEGIFLPVMLVAFAAYEWYRWFYEMPLKPMLFSIFALGGVCWAVYRISSHRETVRLSLIHI